MTVWRRLGPSVVLAGIALCIGATVLATVSGRSVGSPATSDPDDFSVAGTGELPTRRPDLRPARAPLSAEEAGYAAWLAKKRSEIPAGATDVRGEPGAQVLYTDLPGVADAEGGARLAVVALYDYTGDLGYQVVVDLTASTVRSTDSHPELQPPIVPDEADAAVEIALASSQPLAFRDQFEEEMGVPLLTREQVSYSAGAWRYDGTAPEGKVCGKHRCAQILVQSPSGSYLSTSDFVVDLTARTVLVLRGA